MYYTLVLCFSSLENDKPLSPLPSLPSIFCVFSLFLSLYLSII